MRHGAEGYAVYFHCLELIVSDLEDTNVTFELEHDSEIIADNLKIKGDSSISPIDKVNNILKTLIDLNLFQENENRIFCLKLARRLDTSITRNPKIKELIKKSRVNNDLLDDCTGQSGIVPARIDKNRLEENRIDKKRLDIQEDIKSKWNNFIDDLTESNPKHKIPKISSMTKSRLLKYNQRVKDGMDFDSLFPLIGKSDFLLSGDGWSLNFDWVVSNDTNYAKIMEGNYTNKGSSKKEVKQFIDNDAPWVDFDPFANDKKPEATPFQ